MERRRDAIAPSGAGDERDPIGVASRDRERANERLPGALDPRLGGLFTERWDNGGQVIASVTGWAQDEHLQLTGPFHIGVAVGVATFDLAGTGTGTVLRFSFRAIGVVDAEVGEAMSRGWAELVQTRLKALVETGTRLGIDPDEPPTIQPVR